MPAHSRNNLILLAGASVLFLLALWLVPHVPEPILVSLQGLTGHAVVGAASLLGLAASYDPVSQLFMVAGFEMLLAPECVALHYFAILWLAILLMPRQSLRRKLVALPCCSLALFIANILRLVVLGLVGRHYPGQFDLVHDVVWEVAFALLTFLLCFAWTFRPRSKGKKRSGMLVASLFFAALFASLLHLGRSHYLSAVAWVADKVLLLTQENLSWSSRWWAVTQKQFVMIRLQGEEILYHLAGREFTVDFWQDFLGMALFWGLCAGSLAAAIGSHRRRSAIQPGTVVIGTLLILAAQVGSVVLIGLLLAAEPRSFVLNVLWLMRGASVLLPVLLWWVFRRATPKGSRGLAIQEGF